MKDFFDDILTWIKSNWIIAAGAGLLAVIMFFPRVLRKLLGTNTRRRRRTLPRSVGTRRRKTRRTRKQYTKGGKAKKPWQIKGSEAARRHMAKLRRMR